MRAAVLAAVLAGCAGLPKGPAVRVRAVADPAGGVRVTFQRAERGVAGHPARLDATAGRLDEITFAPDLLTVTAWWRDGADGRVRCRFPYGGEAVYPAVTEPVAPVEYVFLEEDGIAVTGTLPDAPLVLPALPVTVEAPADALPLVVRIGDRAIAEVRKTPAEVRLPLPQAPPGVLVDGEFAVVLETADGRRPFFLLGIDADGRIAAVSGILRKW